MDSSTTQLAVMYHEDGNEEKAFSLFKQAAERGYPEAMGWLAACYQYGYGTEVNSLAAVQWLEKRPPWEAGKQNRPCSISIKKLKE